MEKQKNWCSLVAHFTKTWVSFAMMRAMAEKIIVANWKANKTFEEALSWVNIVGNKLVELKQKVILCPTSIFIVPIIEEVKSKNLSEFIILGSQDISQYPAGAYTGEVTASQLAGLIKFSIVGHSERRKYFGQTDQDVIDKVALLLQSQITPILCVSDLAQLNTYIEKGKIIIENAEKIIFVYEPPSAISGGSEYHPDTPEDANENAKKIGEKIGKPITTIYGGSINPDNVNSFFAQPNIHGGLVGQASLDSQTFAKILEKIRNNNSRIY